MSAACYRCGGSTESIDNIQQWSFFGGSVQKVTEMTSETSIRVRSTNVSHRGPRPWPIVCDDTLALCRSCWGDVMSFLGVGKRPERRMSR